MKLQDRRALLKFLAASPLLTQFQPAHASADEPALASAPDALDVFDLEAAAQKQVPPAHWGYLQSGVDGEATLRANATAFARYQLKSRRLVNVSHVTEDRSGRTHFYAHEATPPTLSPDHRPSSASLSASHPAC